MIHNLQLSSTDTSSAVTDANITVVVSDIANSVTSKSYQFNTSTSNTGTFAFSVSSVLSKLMKTYDSAGNTVNIYDQQIQITAVASVGNQNQTGAGTVSNTMFLINPSLNINYTIPQFNSTASGKSYSIVFAVTENGSAVSGASVMMSNVNFKGISYSQSNLTMITNSSGMSEFTFTFSGSAGAYNQTFNVETNTTNTSIGHATATVQFMTPAHSTSSSLTISSVIYAIIGVVIAAVIIAFLVVYVRRPKTGKKS